MHTFTDPDLLELDRIWPLGQQLVVPENGTIIVAGAYEGRYMDYLSELFPTASIFGFEPQKVAWQTALNRLRGKPKVECFNYGLGTAKREMALGKIGTDGASVAESEGDCKSIYIMDELVR